MRNPGLQRSSEGRGPVRAPAGRVEWIASADDTDRTLLRRWSAAVGPPVVESMVGGVAATESADQGGPSIRELVVVSWNVRVGGGDVLGLVDDLRAGRLTGQPVEHFVLLLQEAHRGGEAVPPVATGCRIPRRIAHAPPRRDRVDIVAAARELGLDLFYVPSMRNGRGPRTVPEDRGNAILSTLPLSAHRALELPFEAQRRVSVVARMELPAGGSLRGPLDLLSAHLDNRSRPGRLRASVGAGRLRQARMLVEALSPETPAVLGGDLNTWAGERLERTLPFLRSHFPNTPRGPAPATYAVGTPFARRLDHLFYRLPAGYRARSDRAASRYGSDHHPLIGRILPR